jgi:hypothetical protein
VVNVRAGKWRAVVAVLIFFPLLLVAACSGASQPAPRPVTLSYCGGGAQVRPDVVLVVCNTNDITATSLIWSDWGKPTATAKGSALVDLNSYEASSTPDYVRLPIEIAVSKIVNCAKSAQAYSTLRYAFPDGSPFQGVPADVKNLANEQDGPVPAKGQTDGIDMYYPPANQTVSLAC